MRGIGELDYYELLEISRTASVVEIEHAYRLAQQVYAEGSLALYSVFESHDAAAIRKRLDDAYRILSDSELRSSYDESQSFEPDVLVETTSPGEPGNPGFDLQTSLDLSGAASTGATLAASQIDDDQEYDAFEDEGGSDFDGLRLRRTRLFRGYEINDISDATKVSGAHLRNIEEENFADLPADVYVRGFVTAYASTIGLDPKIVVPSYMALVQESRTGNQRSRFLGRQ
jgi:curved DNA-binding protein CbpA